MIYYDIHVCIYSPGVWYKHVLSLLFSCLRHLHTSDNVYIYISFWYFKIIFPYSINLYFRYSHLLCNSLSGVCKVSNPVFSDKFEIPNHMYLFRGHSRLVSFILYHIKAMMTSSIITFKNNCHKQSEKV